MHGSIRGLYCEQCIDKCVCESGEWQEFHDAIFAAIPDSFANDEHAVFHMMCYWASVMALYDAGNRAAIERGEHSRIAGNVMAAIKKIIAEEVI